MIFAPDGKTLRRLLSRPGCLGPGILSRQKAWQEALRTERGCREARSAMQNRPFGKAEQAVLRLQQAAVATRWASMHCATRQILRKHITKSAKQMCPPSAGKQPGGMGWHRKIKDCSLCPNGESRKKWRLPRQLRGTTAAGTKRKSHGRYTFAPLRGNLSIQSLYVDYSARSVKRLNATTVSSLSAAFR